MPESRLTELKPNAAQTFVSADAISVAIHVPDTSRLASGFV